MGHSDEHTSLVDVRAGSGESLEKAKNHFQAIGTVGLEGVVADGIWIGSSLALMKVIARGNVDIGI